MINILIVDVHTHLDNRLFKDDVDLVIARAKEAGVKRIITNGITPKTNRAALELAKKFDIVEAALGMYPEDALGPEDVDETAELKELKTKGGSYFDVDAEIEFIKKQKPIALGEVGLDYKWGSDEKRQKLVFQKFIELSEKLKVPLIVHSRNAESDVIDMLESSNAKKVVMHCFGGKHKLVRRSADLGHYFSIPCNVVRSDHFKKIANDLHLSQLLTETDAPYLSPFPDKRNEPSFIFESLKTLAEIKGMNVEETAQVIFQNYQKLF